MHNSFASNGGNSFNSFVPRLKNSCNTFRRLIFLARDDRFSNLSIFFKISMPGIGGLRLHDEHEASKPTVWKGVAPGLV
jgi:hypothetical protein